MTPPARYAAAAEVLDVVTSGVAAERALTNWARRHRFAGSGDRAAVRDIVFDIIRRKRSVAALGGARSGRALVLGLLRDRGEDPEAVFTGSKYALSRLSDTERFAGGAPTGNAKFDIPDWIATELQSSLGKDFAAICGSLRHRAPVFLRRHARRTSLDGIVAALAVDGIEAEAHPLSPTALHVTGGERRIRQSRSFKTGLVELQDAASQAVCDRLGVCQGERVLDFCAGGGGKALALAARGASVWAHDADQERMADLPARAHRAQDPIALVTQDQISSVAPFDLVLVDAPCSGSGAWRRQVEGKWSLTQRALLDLVDLQAEILQNAAGYVCPGGRLAYATCSLLERENAQQVEAFTSMKRLREPGNWALAAQHHLTPLDGGDGFFLAILQKAAQP